MAADEEWGGHGGWVDGEWDDNGFVGETVGDVTVGDVGGCVGGESGSVEIKDDQGLVRHGGDATDTMNLYGFACASREIVTKGERRVDEVDGAAIVELGVGVGLLRVGVGID